MNRSPSWPTVIHYHGDAELVYIEDERHWQDDTDLCYWRYDKLDRLIDSEGRIFSLHFDTTSGMTEIIATDETITLEAFSRLLQEHLFALAQTCVSKVVLREFEDGFRTLAQLEP